MLDVFGHQAVNALPSTHAGERWNGFDEVTQRVKRNRAQTFKAQFAAQLGVF